MVQQSDGDGEALGEWRFPSAGKMGGEREAYLYCSGVSGLKQVGEKAVGESRNPWDSRLFRAPFKVYICIYFRILL